jgi:hypothetical protein
MRLKGLVLVTALLGGRAAAQTQPVEAPLDTLYQTYDEGVIYLPFSIGLRIPSYDRVNGLSLPWGPHIAVPGGRMDLDPIVTYRSNLGEFDPSFKATARFGHFDQLDVFGGRGTFTNDTWIRSDIINSLTSIGVGTDARNYYRSDRVRADYSHAIETDAWEWKLWAGGNHEFDWSTGIHEKHSTAPWSFFGRKDTLKMRRINPVVAHGHITSALVGVDGKYERADMKGKFGVQLEQSIDKSGTGFFSGNNFTQLTIDARTTFPTFGLQSFEFKGHAVTSWNSPPAQRWVYLGGAGTLSTVDLLALGGDKLFYARGDYNVPLVRPLLPFVGAPVLSVMYSAGSAGVDELPDFIQNVGAAIGLKVIKIEYWIDPSYQKTPYSHKSKFSIGFSLSL